MVKKMPITTRPKAKKGQVLVFALVLMAAGLIIITPLLHFLNSSYTLYSKIQSNTFAYYAADAMMNTIMADMASGQNITDPNQDANYNINNFNWINNCSVVTTVNSAGSIYTSTQQSNDWAYLDPGCGLGLGTLTYGQNYSFEVYLPANSSVTANWYFDDTRNTFWGISYCDYYCVGNLWLAYENNTLITGNLSTGQANTPLQLSLNWVVPIGGSGNYSIIFQNKAWRYTQDFWGNCNGVQHRSMSDVNSPPAFSGTGDPDFTWVQVGILQGTTTVVQYQDYTVTTTATTRNRNGNKVSITAGLRETPGPLMWWDEQTVQIISWQVTYS